MLDHEKYHTPSNPWIGVDLDGTLAKYSGYQGPNHIGEPIPLMVSRVKHWLREGREVRIVTARVHVTNQGDDMEQLAVQNNRMIIDEFCKENFGRTLPIQSNKDYRMLELWDDRAVQVEPNTGRRVDGKE